MEQTEFSGAVGANDAVVPPGATLSATSSDGTAIHLDISVDFSTTTENVTAMGLVDVVQDKVNPVESEAQAIVTCANYVRSLPEQINQSQPSSPEFWNNFASDGGEATVIDDAAEETGGFFDNVLPKLISLVSDTIFH